MTRTYTLALAVCGLLLAGCQEEVRSQTAKSSQAQKAAEAANAITFTENAEIDNIKRRIELTANPGALGFIVLLNESGQPILYEGVRGKITSGSKRLTKPYQVLTFGNGNGGSTGLQVASPSDEGTWGASNEYIFYWNTTGEYRQWNGKYLYSDKPLRLRVEPLVVAVQ